MGLFDFLKGKGAQLSPEKTNELTQFALRELLKKGARYDQVIRAVIQQGCSDTQADAIVQEAVRLKRTHFREQEVKPIPTTKATSVNRHVPGLYAKLQPYAAYVVHFIGLQTSGDYAPIGAYCTPEGTVTGFAFIYNEDCSYDLSPDQAVKRMTQRFNEKLQAGAITSWVILYHSSYTPGSDKHLIAEQGDKLKAITVAYRFTGEEIRRIGIPYHFESDAVRYAEISEFTPEENKLLFETKPDDTHNYFADREIIENPQYTAASGITVITTNNRELQPLWGGIAGFENAQKPMFRQLLTEYIALTMTTGKTVTKGDLIVYAHKAGNLLLKVFFIDKAYKSCLPVIKTNIKTPVTIKRIEEWEQTENTVAIATGNGKDTFGLHLLLTDYAEHKTLYHSNTSLVLRISAVAFVMDTHDQTYTAYLPSSDLPGHACFDFFGVVLQFRPVQFFPEAPVHGYLLTVRLVTHPDDPDMFNVDMFVAKENMRFDQLRNGMKVCGMLQFQAELATE